MIEMVTRLRGGNVPRRTWSLKDWEEKDGLVITDGQWHEYEIPVATHVKWRGKTICGVRLDPTTGGAAPGSKIGIDWIIGESFGIPIR
jgi:hypothetical protein